MSRWGSQRTVWAILMVGILAASCTSTAGSTETTTPTRTESTRSRDVDTTTPRRDETTTSEHDPSTTTAGGQTGDIGVLGCSNTAQHVDGYTAASDEDRLVASPLGGGDIATWADPGTNGYDSHWEAMLSTVAPGSVDAIWVQICPRGAGADVGAGDEATLTSVVERLRAEYGDVVIYISGINLYEDGYICRKMGEHGVSFSWSLADWGVANLGLVRGPETGPLGPGTVDGDGCHLSPAGEALVGEQLVAWFDQG